MKIKFNLKAGLSLTEEETKEYLKVAGDVATKLFSTKTKKKTGVKPVSSSCIKTSKIIEAYDDKISDYDKKINGFEEQYK